MPNPIAGIVGGAVGSAIIGGSAAKSAAKTQARAADRAAQLQQDQFERQIELQRPLREAGERALPKLEAASEYTPFGQTQFRADPGAAFRLKEGEDALKRAFAASGNFLSGRAGAALTRYGQDYASQEYMNAFNRFQTERQARLGPLQALVGVGQTSVGQLGQAGQQYATNAGEALTSGAAARASGYVGQANALTGALGTGLNFYQNQQYLNKLAPQNAAPTGGYGDYTPANYGFSNVQLGR